MDVSGSLCRRLEVASESVDSDIVADDILMGIDAVIESASATLKTTSLLVLGIDNLIRCSLYTVSRGENKWSLIIMMGLLVPIQDLVEDGSGSGSGSSSR